MRNTQRKLKTMEIGERKQKLFELLTTHNRCTFEYLANELEVSKRTVKRYLDELEAANVISFNTLDTEELCGENTLIDHNEDVAEKVVRKMMIEKLMDVLPLLTDDEYELIQAIYFDEMSERDYAKKTGVYRNAIHKKKVRILEKLKNFLEN